MSSYADEVCERLRACVLTPAEADHIIDMVLGRTRDQKKLSDKLLALNKALREYGLTIALPHPKRGCEYPLLQIAIGSASLNVHMDSDAEDSAEVIAGFFRRNAGPQLMITVRLPAIPLPDVSPTLETA